jgi:hypothetical protein
MLNGHKGLSRRQILRAAGRHCDVIEVNQHPDKPELVGITYAEAGRPMSSWVGIYANPDSAMYPYPNPTSLGFGTQEERGARYQQIITRFLTTTAPNGDVPMVGLAWWEYMDKVSEKSNWGLVSPRNNAYDGVEAVVAAGTDPWGYPTGGEDRNFGDFLGSVMTAHDGIPSMLGGGTSDPPPPPPGDPLTVSIVQPSTGTTVGGTISVKASASTAATRINLLLDDNVVGLYSGTTASFSWDTTQAANGNHRWVAKAFDAAGNVAQSQPVDVTVSNLTVAITAPVSGVVERRTKQIIAASASAAVKVEFYVNGTLKCTGTVAPYTCAWQVPAVDGRTYRLHAQAYDAAGNVATSPTVTVTVTAQSAGAASSLGIDRRSSGP